MPYKIIGPYRVCEREPGETLADKDLDIEGISIDHLVSSGHLESTKRGVAASTSEDQP